MFNSSPFFWIVLTCTVLSTLVSNNKCSTKILISHINFEAYNLRQALLIQYMFKNMMELNWKHGTLLHFRKMTLSEVMVHSRPTERRKFNRNERCVSQLSLDIDKRFFSKNVLIFIINQNKSINHK